MAYTAGFFVSDSLHEGHERFTHTTLSRNGDFPGPVIQTLKLFQMHFLIVRPDFQFANPEPELYPVANDRRLVNVSSGVGD